MDVQSMPSHELVQAESQASVDALRRLVTTRDALAHMLEAQPTLAEPDARSAQSVLDALPGFWASPASTGGVTRSTMLGRHLASVMKEQATLRRLDGTLSEPAASLATRVTAGIGDALPVGVHARELMLGDVPHAGSLVVVEDGSPEVALLFTAHGGWEAFDSLDRLLISTRRRLLEEVDVAEGTGLEDDLFAEAKTRGTIGSREIAGQVFDTLAGRMTEVQRGRIALAADNYGLDSDQPDAARHLGDRIRYELSPAAILDVDAIDHLREARLLEASVTSRLANVPGKVRIDWYEARDSYNHMLMAADMLHAATGARPPLTLRAFASRELAATLASMGIDESPEAIVVEVGRIEVLPKALGFLAPLPGSTEKRRIPLVDLASQNIGRFSLEGLHAMDTQGASLRTQLGPDAIREMVRNLDLVNRYQAHIEERLRQGPVGVLTRSLATSVQAAHMRMASAEARLSYYLPDEPHSFIDDREERGFRWVEAALDTPSGPRHVDGHEIVVSQLTYQQVPLDGILIFASRSSASVSRVVVYTPGAPDGLTFREFENRQDAARRLLYHPAFREYLLDRLPAEFATVSPNGTTRQFAGDRLAHWVLGASGNTSYTLTAEPFGERELPGNFVAAAYDTTVEKYRRDARFLARSTADADSDTLLAYAQARLGGDPANKVLTSAITELPASLARMMQASWRFYDHVKAGDTGQAVVAFTEGYVNALNLVVPPFVGGRHIARAIVRSRSALHGVADTAVRLTPPRVRFDDRYASRSLRKAGKPDQEGIFRVRGQSYVEQDGTFFLVHFDVDYSRWRLAPRQGALDARFTGPMIEQVDGQWIYARGVGLCGGMRRFCERLNLVALGDDVAAPVAAPDGAPPVGRVPGGARRVRMPPVMEPFRDEVTAALADNPSGSALIRADGTHLKIVVSPRSALIVDPHLHPDIAELSAHQRRVFLHELDTRFPLRGERADVLNARGWAQHDGRRVPSPPPSPGATPDVDIQFPSISSSTSEPTPSLTPALTASQQGRWDEALAAARTAPRSPHRSSIGPAGQTVTDTLPATEVVPVDEWPDRMWYFSESRFESEFWPGSNREGVTLGAETPGLGVANGMHTYPVSALPPEAPVGRLSEVLGTSPIHHIGQRDPLGYALQIDMARLRDARAWGAAQNIQNWELGFELRRRVLPSGEYQYFLHSSAPARIPSRFIFSVGRRGGRPAPLPPVPR